jgi:hypothetical protein
MNQGIGQKRTPGHTSSGIGYLRGVNVRRRPVTLAVSPIYRSGKWSHTQPQSMCDYIAHAFKGAWTDSVELFNSLQCIFNVFSDH